MKARLNKNQIKMLLDGKALTSGRFRFSLPEDEGNEVRTLLQRFIDEPRLFDYFSVFVDTVDAKINVTKKGGE